MRYSARPSGNIVLGHNGTLMAQKPGSLGQPIPRFIGTVVDDNGNELPRGEVGHIAFKRPNPAMLLEYWNKPQATKAKFVGDWLLTGDLGQRDEDGYFWYRGRVDDIITSAGYRIGPGEIEEALLRHPPEFVDSLPTTTTGKIMRRELREREREKARAAAT